MRKQESNCQRLNDSRIWQMQKSLHPNVNREDCNLIKCCNRGGCEWGFSFPFLWKKNPVFEDDEDSENERLGSSTLPNPPEMATAKMLPHSLLLLSQCKNTNMGMYFSVIFFIAMIWIMTCFCLNSFKNRKLRQWKDFRQWMWVSLWNSIVPN